MRHHRISVAVAAAALTLTGLAGVTTRPATATTSGPDCGRTITKSTGAVWQCTFAEPFSGRRLDRSKWSPLTSLHSATVKPECRVDSTDNIRVSRGRLRLTVRKLRQPISCRYANGSYRTRYTAGAVSTGSKFSQTYGRFEVRAKFPSTTVSGLHSAIWMWPQLMRYGDLSGEIDIAEYRTYQPGKVVPTLHYKADGDAGPTTHHECYVARPGDFHTYAVEWTRSTMTFVYDGRTCWTHNWQPAGLTKPAPFNEPFFLILNQSIANKVGLNAFQDGVTPLPATMQVDYVRVWK